MICNTVPPIKFSPASLSFTIEEGDPVTHSLALWIENEGGAARPLEWELSTNVPGITFNPELGRDTKVVVVMASAVGLKRLDYAGVITITAKDSPNSPQLVPVSLTVKKTEVIPIQTLKEKLARWLRPFMLNEIEGVDGITPWEQCGQDTKDYWLRQADKILAFLEAEK